MRLGTEGLAGRLLEMSLKPPSPSRLGSLEEGFSYVAGLEGCIWAPGRPVQWISRTLFHTGALDFDSFSSRSFCNSLQCLKL